MADSVHVRSADEAKGQLGRQAFGGMDPHVNTLTGEGLAEAPKEAAQALRLALHHGVNPKDICLWSLFRASGNAELLRVFLEAGANANVNDEGYTLLHFLTAFPDTKPSMEVLLEFQANINARDSFFGFTPLMWAVVQRRIDMVQFLLAHGAAIELLDDQPWTTPRFWAKHLEEPAILQALA